MSSKTGNPFLDDDEEEIDDFTFLSHPKQGRDGYMLQKENTEDCGNYQEPTQMQLNDECRRIQERTLQSSHVSLGLIHESEQVGILTAEELVRQREQLQNVEQNLDKINSTMRISQKHINSIKSMFGGIKNYFSRGNTGDSAAVTANQAPVSKPLPSGLQETVGNLRASERSSEVNHPALRIRGIDTLDSQALPTSDDYSQLQHKPGSYRGMGVSQASVPQSFDEQLDKNLESMSLGLGRLKVLARGLHDEIETQNDMLDDIVGKVDRADESLEHQNRQIKRILKK